MDENASITLGFGPDDTKVKISFDFEENFPFDEEDFVMEMARLIRGALT